MFLNETQHLQAPLLAAVFHAVEDHEEVYENLDRWRKSRGMSDEYAADLYSRMAEDDNLLTNIRTRGTIEELTTAVSRHLWASDKEFKRG